VSSDRLDDFCALAMDWLRKKQTFDPRTEANFWRNQWQTHTSMVAHIEMEMEKLGLPNTAVSSERSESR
jgi:hypothetical protein